MTGLKDELDFCDEIDVILSRVVFRSNQSYLACKYIVFEEDRYTYLSGFAGRDIKYLCIWSSHRKYLLLFINWDAV